MPGKESLSPAMAKLADEILLHGIDSGEVLRLRREVFRDGIVEREEAKLLFHLNEQTGANADEAWYDFFVEALSDYFVWKQEPVGYLSEHDADFLVDEITEDGKIDERTEFGLLVNIIHRLRVAPENVIALALEGVRETVLGGGCVLFGPERRRPGVIDPADVDIIRTVVFGSGGDGSLTITRREAELLFELNDRTVEKENAPQWRQLFVQGIAHHLMFPRGAPAVPDRAEAARRERWLEQRRGTGELMKGMLQALNTRVFSGAAAGLLGGRAEQVEAAAERTARWETFARESIAEAEAKWLKDHVMADGFLHENERALLAFIKENSPNIHPSLEPLFEKAGL